MAATLLGATIAYGGQPTISGYIVETWDGPGAAEIASEDVEDADGKRVSRLIFGVYPKISATLKATTGTFSEFVEGAMCTATGYTAYYVDSAAPALSKGQKRIALQMTKIFG